MDGAGKHKVATNPCEQWRTAIVRSTTTGAAGHSNTQQRPGPLNKRNRSQLSSDNGKQQPAAPFKHQENQCKHSQQTTGSNINRTRFGQTTTSKTGQETDTRGSSDQWQATNIHENRQLATAHSSWH